MGDKNNTRRALSSGDLLGQINSAREKKTNFLFQLRNNVSKTEMLIKKNLSEAKIAMEQKKVIILKQKSITQLSKSLSDRLNIDKKASTKLQELTEEQLEKKMAIQKKIDQIKKRNEQRIKQLKDFEEKYIKKLNQDYRKDKQKQERLLSEYENILHQQGRIKETQSYRKAIEAQDWKAIIEQKRKLQKMIRQYQKKQQLLIKQQNPQMFKKAQATQETKKAESEKKYLRKEGRKRDRSKDVDAKQIGNQYLQYAKKVKEAAKQKAKNKLMDVNLKCIDYETDIMAKIARNTGDLSKIKMQPAATTVKESKYARESHFKTPYPDSGQTKRFLKANPSMLSSNGSNL